MKKFIINCFFAASLLLPYACKKDAAPAATPAVTADSRANVAAPLRWQGWFISGNGMPQSRKVPDRYFIKDGAARIFSEDIGEDNRYSTRISLLIPASAIISADSINLEAGVKNPAASSAFDPSFGRDVTLYLIGEGNAVYINNTATADVDPDAPERAGIKLGPTVHTVPALQYNLETYNTFVLQTFNFGVIAYRDNMYLGGLPYNDAPLLGRLVEIGIAFKGSGYVDYIKLYNSATGKLLLSEDFNTDGKSTIIVNP